MSYFEAILTWTPSKLDTTMVSLPEYIWISLNLPPQLSHLISPCCTPSPSLCAISPSSPERIVSEERCDLSPVLTATAEEVKATLSLTRSQIGIPSLKASVGTKWGHLPPINPYPLPNPLTPCLFPHGLLSWHCEEMREDRLEAVTLQG